MSNETKGPQPPAEAQPCGCGEATCTVPWEPGCGLGKSEQHAVVQAQSVGEVLSRIEGKLREAGARLPAPPVKGTIESAVVTGLSIALAVVEAEAPPPSAPVGVDVGDKDCLTTRARELLADEYRKRGIGTGLVNDAGTATSVAIAAIATALSQQPAAVGGAMVERAARAWCAGTDTPFDQLPDAGKARCLEDMRVVLTAALAAQPGGSDNDR